MLGVSCSSVVRQQPDQPCLCGLLRDAGGGLAVTWRSEQKQQPEATLHSGGQHDVIRRFCCTTPTDFLSVCLLVAIETGLAGSREQLDL